MHVNKGGTAYITPFTDRNTLTVKGVLSFDNLSFKGEEKNEQRD